MALSLWTSGFHLIKVFERSIRSSSQDQHLALSQHTSHEDKGNEEKEEGVGYFV